MLDLFLKYISVFESFEPSSEGRRGPIESPFSTP